VATVAAALAGAIRAVWKWRERRRYGPGPPVINLSGQRLTWAQRTGTAPPTGKQPGPRPAAGVAARQM